MKALEFAHNKKVWHRDIKPENILVDENDNVVLADFGIAHFCDELLITAVETKAAERLANFQYSAPEQRKHALCTRQRREPERLPHIPHPRIPQRNL